MVLSDFINSAGMTLSSGIQYIDVFRVSSRGSVSQLRRLTKRTMSSL